MALDFIVSNPSSTETIGAIPPKGCASTLGNTGELRSETPHKHPGWIKTDKSNIEVGTYVSVL